MKLKLHISPTLALMAAVLLSSPVSAVKHIILQQGFSFNPQQLEGVMVGDTVRWVWTSGFHTTTSAEIPQGAIAWDATLSSSGQAFEYKVQQPGYYYYVCTPHEAMGMVGSFNAESPGNTLFGTLYYDNALMTGIPTTTVRLNDQNGDELQATTTDIDGHFSFTAVPDGTYSVTLLTQVPWGGVNANDALGTLKHFTGMTPLSGLRLVAADVDQSSFVNAIDALAIAKRFVSLINSFPAGDWYFEPYSVTLSGNSTTSAIIHGICLGDTDGSYNSF